MGYTFDLPGGGLGTHNHSIIVCIESSGLRVERILDCFHVVFANEKGFVTDFVVLGSMSNEILCVHGARVCRVH